MLSAWNAGRECRNGDVGESAPLVSASSSVGSPSEKSRRARSAVRPQETVHHRGHADAGHPWVVLDRSPTSARRSRPPGASTRSISPNATAGSGVNIRPIRQTHDVEGVVGWSMAEASTTATVDVGRDAALRRAATSTMPGAMSLSTTCRRARRAATTSRPRLPGPAASSSTRSPGWRRHRRPAPAVASAGVAVDVGDVAVPGRRHGAPVAVSGQWCPSSAPPFRLHWTTNRIVAHL